MCTVCCLFYRLTAVGVAAVGVVVVVANESAVAALCCR